MCKRILGWVGGLAGLLVALCAGPLDARETPPDDGAFPHLGILPKAETGATRLLEHQPTYDGRGTVVAIFDTGVDPGAAGLQVTSDGKPKIIDVVDGSGSGDVDTSTVRKAEKGTIEGLSGRTITIPKDWKNPKGAWHVGVKRAYELYPEALVSRLKKKRRKKFDERHRQALVKVREAIETADAAESNNVDERKDLRKQLKVLEQAGREYEDPGPVFDVVCFHDGEHWRAVVDTDEDGALDDEKAMANYRVNREWSTFGKEDLLNYALNVYEDGDVVSIVVDVGAHGTHVAGIVAAHFPGRPELNGVAPGAQIVAVKIGDTRQGSSSMGTGEERGIVAVLRNKCDLINQSYGGASPSPNDTRQDELLSEVVNKQGIIFVASAGNDGPCLSTVGSPGGTNEALFGVGAYVSPAMMKVQYSMRKAVPATHFTWSARGPTLDGAIGVDFSAPGGAIAPVPTWSLEGLTQMHGTSMSSPNLCGNVALLLSGMKAESIPSSPHRVRRALANTAAPIPGLTPFGQGAGLIQVDKALEYLRANKDRPDEDVRYEVRLLSSPGGRGIYLREAADVNRPREFRVRVAPKLHEDADHRRRVDLDQRIHLVATQPWIDVADHLLLTHGGRRFDVRVDPTALPPGAHIGMVEGHDSHARDRGPLFRFPVTVIKPEPPQEPSGQRFIWTHDMTPGPVVRHFMTVPAGATWADIRLRGGKHTTSKVFVMQAVQILPQRSFKERYLEEYVRLDEGEETVYSMAVEGGRTLEVALAQYWSSLDKGQCQLSVTFRGIVPEPKELVIEPGHRLRGVDVSTPLARTWVSPSASVTFLRRTIAPSKAEVAPLDPTRDTLPREKLAHALVLTYSFELKKPARVKPRGPTEYTEVLWEEWSSGLWMLTDEKDRLVANGPIWDDDRFVKVGKGKYTVRVHLRHDDPGVMKRWKRAPLALDFKIDEIDLPVHADPRERGGSGRPEFEPGERRRLFVFAPAPKDLPSFVKTGDVLHGEVAYGDEQPEREGAGRRPGGWPLRIVVGDPSEPEDDDPKDDDSDEDAPTPTTAEVLRDAFVAQLSELRAADERAAFDKLANQVLAKFPNHLPVLVEQLKMVDGDGPPHEGGSTPVLQAAARILQVVDERDVAAHFGVAQDPDADGKAKRTHEQFVEQRDALRSALFSIARIADDAEAFASSYAALSRWVDITDEKYAALRLQKARYDKAWGEALQLLNASIDENPRKPKYYEERQKLYEELGWSHLAEAERAWMPARFPADKPLF